MAPVAASPSPQADPAAPIPAVVSRPEGLPESYWDKDKGFKAEDFNALVTRDAAEQSRRLTLAQKPEDVKIELPTDFKLPEGMTFELNPGDARAPLLQSWAVKHGIPQAAVNDLIGIDASAQVQGHATLSAQRTAEVTKLGVNGPARVDAVTNFFKGTLGDKHAAAIIPSLATAAQVEAYEALIQKISTQGGAGFTQQHRTQEEAGKIPGYESMSFEQKRHAQDQLRARKTG